MSENAPAEMPPQLVQFLLGGKALVVATVNEQGAPVTSLMTWAVARNPLTVALAVDLRNRALRNIRPSIVYVLDQSGSMGRERKLQRAVVMLKALLFVRVTAVTVTLGMENVPVSACALVLKVCIPVPAVNVPLLIIPP